MAAGGSQHGGRFPSTHWSLVDRAGRQSADLDREALGQLLTAYLPALRAHLVYGKRLAPERSDDLLQEFVASKIIERDLIASADRQRGRFRTFLLTALDRFVSNCIRDERAKKRSPGDGAVELGSRVGMLHVRQPAQHAYEVAWARGVVTEALRLMQTECEQGGRADVWGVFECRIAGPTLEGTPPADYAELVERFDLKSPSQASNVLMTGKRMYARALRTVVGKYAGGHEIDLEIEELRGILAAPAS